MIMANEEHIQCSRGGGEAFEWNQLDFVFQLNSILTFANANSTIRSFACLVRLTIAQIRVSVSEMVASIRRNNRVNT